MSTKAKIQKVRAEVEAHEERGWLKGYQEGLAVREEQTVNAQNANEKLKARIAELKAKRPAPTTARGALDLAWELGHRLKDGQLIPAGTECMVRFEDGDIRSYTTRTDDTAQESKYPGRETRTFEPLPEWLSAPAVHATCGCHGIELWQPHNAKDGMWVSMSGEYAHWTSLRDVTPLHTMPQEDPLPGAYRVVFDTFFATNDVLSAYLYGCREELRTGLISEFYRWLDEVRAEAWHEGYGCGRDDQEAETHTNQMHATLNPYRKAQTDD